MRRLPFLVSVPIVGLLALSPVFAQEEDVDVPPRVIPPEECQVEPRPAEELYAILGLAGDAAAEASPTVEPVQFPTPPWEPAPPETETARGVDATIREFIACLNAGDELRASALLTDRGARRLFGVGARDAEAAEQRRAELAEEPAPLGEENFTRLVAITDVSTLGEGRAAALIVVNDPLNPPRGPQTLLLLFAQEGGRWLIDDFLTFSIQRPEPRRGTPTPEDGPGATPTA